MKNTILLKEEHTDHASQILTNAFFNEPYAIYELPDEKQRIEKLKILFKSLIWYYKKQKSLCYFDSELKGLCIAETPHNDLSFSEIEKNNSTFHQQIERALEPSTVKAYANLIHFTETLRSEVMGSEPHWYMGLLAINPEDQGKKIGSFLIQCMIEQAIQSNSPIYLWTDMLDSIKFYQNHHFRIVATRVEPLSKIHFWAMKLDV